MSESLLPVLVHLDAYTANPGDLDWSGLTKLGKLVLHDRTLPEEVLERAQGASVLLTNKVVLSAETIQQLPDLKYIGVTATGYNVVDIQAAADAGIVVTNVPAYSTDSVAQATFALLLEITNQVGHHASRVAEGVWSRSSDFCFMERPLMELSGRTLGLVGFGHIGRAVAQIGRAMGMRVLASRKSSAPPAEAGVCFTSLEEVLQQSDVISLHCPLTPETENLIRQETLAKMKPGAILINTGRGPLICEQDVADALRSGQLSAVGLDVLGIEPPREDNPLIGAPGCFITPHIAWATRESRKRLIETVTRNLEAFLQGAPQNVVSPPPSQRNP